ncbi:MAG: replication protein [Firmicutes bacterium]|nr:replication protein [Bacillota bacterium]
MDLYKQKSTWWYCVCYHKEQLDEVLNAIDVKTYAWILHDKDVNEKTGELKKPHYHFLAQFGTNNRGSWFKRFDTDDMGRIMIEPCISPESAYLYLTHEDPKSKKKNAYVYDKSLITSTIDNLDNPDLRIKKTDNIYNSVVAILNKELTWHEFYKNNSEYILSCKNIDFFANDILKPERDKLAAEMLSKVTKDLNRKSPDGLIKLTQSEMDILPF